MNSAKKNLTLQESEAWGWKTKEYLNEDSAYSSNNSFSHTM